MDGEKQQRGGTRGGHGSRKRGGMPEIRPRQGCVQLEKRRSVASLFGHRKKVVVCLFLLLTRCPDLKNDKISPVFIIFDKIGLVLKINRLL
jgi:hypothetical protein